MTTFDLHALASELRTDEAYGREGHTARTLAREADLRIVLVVMKTGARIAEHRANETAAIQALTGNVRVRLADETADLPAGQLLLLGPGVHHEVEAVVDSAFLLTLGWPHGSK